MLSFISYLIEVAPAGWEKWVEKHKPEFTQRYGDKKGTSIAFAQAWKLSKAGSMPGKSWSKTLAKARKTAKKSGVLSTNYGRRERLHTKKAAKRRARSQDNNVLPTYKGSSIGLYTKKAHHLRAKTHE